MRIVLALALLALTCSAFAADSLANVSMNIDCSMVVSAGSSVVVASGAADFVGTATANTNVTVTTNCHLWSGSVSILDGVLTRVDTTETLPASSNPGLITGSTGVKVIPVTISVTRNGLADRAGSYSGTLKVTAICEG